MPQSPLCPGRRRPKGLALRRTSAGTRSGPCCEPSSRRRGLRIDSLPRRRESGLDLILGQVRCLAAGLVFELVIALPDNPAVFVVAVPDLRAVPTATATAADLPGEYGRPAVFRIAGSLGENILFQSFLILLDRSTALRYTIAGFKNRKFLKFRK